MDQKTRRAVILGTLSVAVLLGAGLATYLLGGGSADSASGIPVIDFSKAPERSYEPTEVLRLAWGQGPSDVWVRPGWDDVGSTLDNFSVTDEGDLIIADHPANHYGARVRRFAPDGTVEATWMTPGGSIFFEPFGTGLMYVQGRAGMYATEQVVLVTQDGSTVVTFAADPDVNSTALFRVGDVLALRTEVPQLAEEPQALRIEPLVWPVVQLTVDGPVAAAAVDPAVGHAPDTDGRLYKRLVEADDWTVTQDATQTITLSDGRVLRIPGLATPLGVDGDVVWMIMPRTPGSDLYVDRAGWPLGEAQEAEVLAARIDGTLVAREVLPWSPIVKDSKRQLMVTRGALWQAVADEQGISILRYEAVGR